MDSDDEMGENHLAICYYGMQRLDKNGKKSAVGITKAIFDEQYDIHETWKNNLSYGLPITKVIRYEAWEFIEGFPTQGFFRKYGGEDFHLMLLLNEFFEPIYANEETVKYNIYENSIVGKLLDCYKHPLSEHDETCKKNPERFKIYKITKKIRQKIFKEQLKYLNFKFQKMGLKEKLSGLAFREKSDN